MTNGSILRQAAHDRLDLILDYVEQGVTVPKMAIMLDVCESRLYSLNQLLDVAKLRPTRIASDPVKRTNKRRKRSSDGPWVLGKEKPDSDIRAVKAFDGNNEKKTAPSRHYQPSWSE